MQHPLARLCVLAGIAALGACSAHHPLILRNATEVSASAEQRHPAHRAPVLVTAQALPENVDYQVLAQIEVGKAWYGRSQSVLVTLADKARELGADAVVEVETWHQPSGYSWWAPHGRGKAVRFIAGRDTLDFASDGQML